LADDLDDLMRRSGIEVVSASAHHANLAREACRRFGKGSRHGAKLNFGDCFAYALAADSGEPLRYKGGDFARTDIKSAL
jgi:ribonuclease VapC